MPLQSYPEFVTLVVPELQRRGRARREYEGSTLREHLYGAGQVRTRAGHPATTNRGPHPG